MRPSAFVLARIAHVFRDLAGQNLGDADRIGDGVGGSLLALRSTRHIYLLPPERLKGSAVAVVCNEFPKRRVSRKLFKTFRCCIANSRNFIYFSTYPYQKRFEMMCSPDGFHCRRLLLNKSLIPDPSKMLYAKHIYRAEVMWQPARKNAHERV